MLKDEITAKDLEYFKAGLQLWGKALAIGMAKIGDAFVKKVERLRETQNHK